MCHHGVHPDGGGRCTMLPVHRGVAVPRWGERQVPLAPRAPPAVCQLCCFEPWTPQLLRWPVAASRPMVPSCRDAVGPGSATPLERSTSAWLAVTTCLDLCYQIGRRCSPPPQARRARSQASGSADAGLHCARCPAAVLSASAPSPSRRGAPQWLTWRWRRTVGHSERESSGLDAYAGHEQCTAWPPGRACWPSV